MVRAPVVVALAVALATTGAAQADSDDPIARKVAVDSIARAGAWWTAAIAADGAAPAIDRAHPLEYLAVAKTRSCRPLRAGRATDARGAARVKACLVDVQATIAGAPAAAWAVARVDDAIAAFPHKQAKKMAALAADAQVIAGSWSGAGGELRAWLVIGADGAVRAVWLTETVTVQR